MVQAFGRRLVEARHFPVVGFRGTVSYFVGPAGYALFAGNWGSLISRNWSWLQRRRVLVLDFGWLGVKSIIQIGPLGRELTIFY